MVLLMFVSCSSFLLFRYGLGTIANLSCNAFITSVSATTQKTLKIGSLRKKKKETIYGNKLAATVDIRDTKTILIS